MHMSDPEGFGLNGEVHAAERRSGRRKEGLASGSVVEVGPDKGLHLRSGSLERPLRRLGWSRSPQGLVVIGLTVSVLLVVALGVAQFVLATLSAIVVGIVIVVTLGAGGLAARGFGELRDSPQWKASGCFLCAAAYLGTATVALVNGVPLIFQQ